MSYVLNKYDCVFCLLSNFQKWKSVKHEEYEQPYISSSKTLLLLNNPTVMLLIVSGS